jgi:hypothetical protein
MLKAAWLHSRKSVRPLKGIFCDDISEFESYQPQPGSPSQTRTVNGRIAGNFRSLVGRDAERRECGCWRHTNYAVATNAASFFRA